MQDVFKASDFRLFEPPDCLNKPTKPHKNAPKQLSPFQPHQIIDRIHPVDFVGEVVALGRSLEWGEKITALSHGTNIMKENKMSKLVKTMYPFKQQWMNSFNMIFFSDRTWYSLSYRLHYSAIASCCCKCFTFVNPNTTLPYDEAAKPIKSHISAEVGLGYILRRECPSWGTYCEKVSRVKQILWKMWPMSRNSYALFAPHFTLQNSVSALEEINCFA